MGLALLKQARQFTLHIRCDNCLRESERVVEMPIGDDVPRDADELIESVFLERLPFRCHPCGGVIGRLFGIRGENAYGY
ncbi:hypothetical protein A6U87_14875 [Rhizobium sp. AC44/96]|nr:hypothetical protein A6U87_14875 [Rhizobium sp. AC44/96]